MDRSSRPRRRLPGRREPARRSAPLRQRPSRLAARPERVVLAVCHELPIRFALNAASGSANLDRPEHKIANATPYLFEQAALDLAAEGIERSAARPPLKECGPTLARSDCGRNEQALTVPASARHFDASGFRCERGTPPRCQERHPVCSAPAAPRDSGAPANRHTRARRAWKQLLPIAACCEMRQRGSHRGLGFMRPRSLCGTSPARVVWPCLWRWPVRA